MKRKTQSTGSFAANNKSYQAKRAKQERVIATIAAASGEAALKEAELRKQCLEAIGDHLECWLETQSEKAIMQFFASMEIAASKTARGRIAMHPTRPEGVNALVADADETVLKRKEEAEQDKLSAAVQASKTDDQPGDTA